MSFPAASAAGTSGDGVAFGGLAAVFLSPAVAVGVAAEADCAGTPGLVLPGASPELLGIELPAAESLTLVSLDFGTAGCFRAAGWVTGARLPALTGDCSVGIGVEAEDISGKMLDAEFAGGAGVELWADQGAG